MEPLFMSDAPAAQAPEIESTTDDDMGAAFDAIMARDTEPEEAPAEAAEAPAEAAEPDPAPEAPEQQEATPAPADVPSDVPLGVKEHWANIPEGARDAIVHAQREMAQKLTDQGRLVSGLKPIQNTLTEMVQEFPALANMKPEQVIGEMRQLATLNQAFNDNPVQAILGLVQQHGLQDRLVAAMQGQAPQQRSSDVQHIAQLKQEIESLKRALDPEHMREAFTGWQTEASVTSQVEKFAEDHKDTWSKVEPHLPAAIQAVQSFLGDSAAPEAVLSQAYELAATQLGIAKAPQPEAAVEAAPKPDPERAKAVRTAESVNVSGSRQGKPRELSEDEQLARAYDAIVARS